MNTPSKEAIEAGDSFYTQYINSGHWTQREMLDALYEAFQAAIDKATEEHKRKPTPKMKSSKKVPSECSRCNEDCIVMNLSEGYFVRVRRASKCKRYIPGDVGRTCKTDVFQSAEQAIDQWDRWQK